MCDFCEKTIEIDCGCITAKIESFSATEKYMTFNYDAYSIDSSFDAEHASVQIKFCPFCGRKL